jgi:transcriptional regulator with XRE-family HTH domain
MDNTTRTFRVRTTLGLTQSEFAPLMRSSQATIARWELGQPEPGPASIVLDAIERRFSLGDSVSDILEGLRGATAPFATPSSPACAPSGSVLRPDGAALSAEEVA